MKILVIAPTPFFADRGTHIRILEEARGLERRGHVIVIATYHIGAEVRDAFNTRIDVRRINHILFWYKKLEAGPDWQKVILDVMLVWKVIYLVLKEQPDVLHAHLHEGALIGWIAQHALFWKRVPLLVDMHGSLTEEMLSHNYLRHPWLKRLFQRLEQWIDRLGDAAIASSWENAEYLQTVRGQDVAAVPDGVDVDAYAEISKTRMQLRARFALPQDAVIVVYAGAFIQNKGILLLLESIPHIVQHAPTISIVLAGFPADLVRAFVDERELQQRVRILSPLRYRNLPMLLRACDIAVDPKDSTTHQASGKLLQYMAAGLPIVCLERPDNKRYLGDGAQYCRVRTPEGLAEGILTLASNTALRAQMGATNAQHAHAFTWDVAAQRIETCYKNILSTHH